MDTLEEEVITAEHPTEEFRSIWTDLRGVGFQQGWMDVDGCNIRYLRSGPADGPKVVLLAGTGGHAETFAANLGALGQQFDCWAIDIPGCGYSDKPDGSYDAITTAKFIKRWADTVGADQIDIVGVSVGSWSALQCAKQYPDLVKHIVLVSPAGGPLPEPADPWYELWHMKAVRTPLISFLTWDHSQDRLAIIPTLDAVAPPANATGLHHAAFSVASLQELCDQYRSLKAHGIVPLRAFNHGVATSMYYADPDGNEIELTVEAFESVEALNEWFATGAFDVNPVGVLIDPHELCARVDAGEPDLEILKPHPDHLTWLQDHLKGATLT